MKITGIFGIGGFSREVLPLVLSTVEKSDDPTLVSDVVFVDRDKSDPVAGIKCISDAEFLSLDTEKSAVVPIADVAIRYKLIDTLSSHGVSMLTVISQSAEFLGRYTLGDGAIICSKCIITDNVQIGRMFHMNLFSYVAHDCQIGDFVTFAPAVKCNGNVIIEDDVYVGTGAVIRQGTPDKPLRIGKGAIIGAGALVLSDVPENATVVGNPARPLKSRHPHD